MSFMQNINIESYVPILFSLYPEIHYRFKYFPFSFYYKREPEILIDIPHKSISSNNNKRFPVFLIVKDADQFPIYLKELDFQFRFPAGFGQDIVKHKVFFKDGKLIKNSIFKETFYFDLSSETIDHGIVSLTCNISIDIVNSKGVRVDKTFINDNFSFGKSTKKSLDFFINDDEKLFDNYYQGDLHYHSDYTKDQVEFGAPLSMTKECGKFLGMKFTLITDHSYDLDDMEDNYLKRDPDVKQFHKMKDECKELSDEEFRLINSEEVTVKNNRGRNVHLIVANEEKFFHGTGDDAEQWLKTTSENSISDVLASIKTNNINSIAIAAHPFVKTPFLEGLLINRGEWSKSDVLNAYKNYGLNLIQILNGELDEGFFIGLKIWIELLLDSKKMFIVAGNDAHGNFSSFRQIELPMMRMVKKKIQLYGKCRTVVYGEKPENSVSILERIKKGSSYITNGAHIDFLVSFNNRDYRFGENVEVSTFSGTASVKSSINFKIASSIFSGYIRSVKIFCGNLIEKKEFVVYEDKVEGDDLYFEEKELELFDFGFDRYYRLEIETYYANNKEIKMVLSNPIWITY